MEALFLLPMLIAELLVPLFEVAFFGMAFGLELLGLVAAGGVEAALQSRYGAGAGQPSTDTKPSLTNREATPISPKPSLFVLIWSCLQRGKARRILRRAMIGFAIAAAMTLLMVWIGNVFFFKQIAGWFLRRAAVQSAMDIDFREASGSLWSGELLFRRVHCVRKRHPFSNFDINLGEARVKIVAGALLFGKAKIQSIEVRDVTGTFERVGKQELFQPRKTFVAERLILGNVRLTIIDRVMTKEPLQGELKLKAYAIAPFRSHWVAFDMLFRANGDGELEGKEFSVHERPIQAGHGTHWQAKNLPVQWFGNAIGSPFSWFQSGEFDLEIEDSWSLAREQEVRSKWDLQFRDLKSAVPDDLPLKQKMLAVPIVAFLNRAPNPLPISFEITFDGNAFKGKASPEAVGLWQIIHDAANKALNAGRDPPQ